MSVVGAQVRAILRKISDRKRLMDVVCRPVFQDAICMVTDTW